MKKKYVSPEIKMIELQTENLMVTSVNVDSYDGNTSDSGIGKDTNPWDEDGEYEF